MSNAKKNLIYNDLSYIEAIKSNIYRTNYQVKATTLDNQNDVI